MYIAELILPFKCHCLFYIFAQDTASDDKKSITVPSLPISTQMSYHCNYPDF